MSRIIANAGGRPVAFTADAAARVARAVSAYERGDRSTRGQQFREAFTETEEIRLGTISETWAKGSNATVTILNPDGSTPSPAITFIAKNWFATVTVSSGTKKVACASVGADKWILLAAEC